MFRTRSRAASKAKRHVWMHTGSCQVRLQRAADEEDEHGAEKVDIDRAGITAI